MRRYNPSEIEPKWQQTWEDRRAYEVSELSDRQKLYVSCMFPYPSGVGMHTGHAFEHAIVDSIARFHRQQGYNVLNPMGWDGFGLPTENYAIKTGVAPDVATAGFIRNFKHQIKRIGASLDWSREINTTDSEYYRWTQWIFTKLFERGLAYQKESLQWWCPQDKTVLANEQVEGGKCWRCGSEVEKKALKQWFFKITEYADALLEELDALEWPDKIKTAQRNWIGKNEGAEIDFAINGHEETIRVFTTRPDTIFGATFLVVAPEHSALATLVTDEMRETVEGYVAAALRKSEIERMAEGKEKTGVPTGSFAVNPATGASMPVWVADYVISGYGSGAIMAVPGHDERDFDFASMFELPIIEVIEKPSGDTSIPYTGEGNLINSGTFSGMPSSEAREEIIAWLEQDKIGRLRTTYRMRDWLISRQRYWGAPIPIIHCPEHGPVAVPEADLPVILPPVDDYAPKGDGRSVLATVDDWVATTCPTCGGPAKRETDTMDGYACSSWYLLRYTDPHNDNAAWDRAKADYWAPVDYYVGGDHAVAHLLYVRFWTHVFKDMGLTGFREPVKRLVYHGYINAPDGQKMSKSKGNVIDPLDVIDQGYGADSLRTYLLFMGPIEQDSPWDPRGIAGIYRFMNRVWNLVMEYLDTNSHAAGASDPALEALRHATIKRVSRDYRDLSFNTATAGLMEYVNQLYRLKTKGFESTSWKAAIETLVVLVSPMAPHIAAELWETLGYETPIEQAGWPAWDEAFISPGAEMTVAVQINGKIRATLTMPSELTDDAVRQHVLANPKVQAHLTGREPRKVIYVPGKLISLVV